MSSIIWMKHEKHGKYPCTSADVDLFRKAGWVQIDPPAPPAPPSAAVVPDEPPVEPSEASEEETPELSRSELIAIAEERGIEVNKKWPTSHLRKVLAL